MLRLLARLRRPWPPNQWRRRLSVPPSATPPPPPLDLKPLPSSSSPSLPSLSSPHLPSTLPRRRSFPTLLAAVSGAALVSAFAFSVALLETPGAAPSLNETLERSKNSALRVLDQMRHTGAAAAVLWKSLSSVLSSANQEVRSGFELRVAALLADIAAASGARRAAIVGAGNGTVVDWLLESVGRGGAGRRGTQAEAARALAHLVADKDVSTAVLGRPHAVPYLLRFIFSFQPKAPKKQYKYSSFDDPGLCKGRSMLVAALMDIITSNCDNPQQSTFRPLLPGNADMRDIAAAIEVIEEGGMHFDDHNGNEDNSDGGKEMRGIGIKVLGGTSVLGFSRAKSLLKLEDIGDEGLELDGYVNRTVVLQKNDGGQSKVRNLAFSTVPGLWDDLQGEHVAVPFAAWALANWALASGINRSHIQELDRDGHAVTAALTAPERSVKWHGSLVARALLSDQNLPLTDSVPEWSSSLLATVSQASKVQDAALSQVALSAFSVSVERSKDAKVVLMEKGLPLMREIAKQMEKHRHIQEALATVLELLYKEDMHFSLEESQRWSGILLRWVFSTFSSETTCSSATKILSCILEDYGPNTIPISQGWLTILLTEVLGASKTSTLKGSSPVKTDKVKTQIDQSNALLAAQVANQLASAVVKVAGNHSQLDPSSPDKHPLADFLLIDPFAAQLKNLSKSNSSKFDAADSAFATLKGIKALTELCSEDATCKNKLNDLGGLCLLRRFLLSDDYEKLAAFEAYDASRVLETQDRDSAKSNDSSASDSNNSTSVRVPSTAHIRRHAARLLTVLSLQPNIKKAIAADGILCKWLDDCASGRIPCCNDHKIQSYARATLLNIFCLDEIGRDRVVGRHPGMVSGNEKSKCPQYADMIFLINPESLHWKISDNHDDSNSSEDAPAESVSPTDFLPTCSDNGIESKTSNNFSSVDDSDKVMQSAIPLFDIVFVHGLRGGPFKSWRIADDKSSTTSKSGLVEKIDQEAGKEGTFWPSEWLAADFPDARFYTVKYKANLTQWSGASLPLQEVSSLLLQKLVAAGIGDRPVVFVAHSMGGLVVKQILYQAKMENYNELVNNTIGVVFYSCPHFGSRLADMPWRMGLVFRPAPSIGELRSGSPRLVELNDFVRQRHNKGLLEVLSFSETQVTPIVEGYGGWAFRLEIVPIESAYPGFGELVVLDATDHVNSCKPVNRSDPSYAKTLDFLQKLKAHMT